MSSKYVIGLDYGTLSCRAVLARCKDGEIIADAVKPYTHQVMEELLPDGKTALERNWALEHPGDYLESMEDTIRSVMEQGKVPKEDVIGIGIDFTSCTMMPVDLHERRV